MARYSRPLDPDDMIGGMDGKCDLCGNPATGYWVAHGQIEICSRCAESMLPSLIADACLFSVARKLPGGINDAKHLLVRIEACFWKAVASLASRPVEGRSATNQPPAPRISVRVREASGWLIERLREKKVWDSVDLRKRGVEAGISKNALYEAKSHLKIPTRRIATPSGDISYEWFVPDGWSPVESVGTE